MAWEVVSRGGRRGCTGLRPGTLEARFGFDSRSDVEEEGLAGDGDIGARGVDSRLDGLLVALCR